MTALLILAAAVVSAYLASFALTPVIACFLRVIDRNVRKPNLKSRSNPPQLLLYTVPAQGMQKTGLAPTFALAATILVVSMTVPSSGNTVSAHMVQCNA
jgi:hypothetical protein